MSDLILPPDKLRDLTGYTQPAAQLRQLQLMGFTRARRDRLGRVVLTWAHYDAVEAGRNPGPESTPRLHIPRLHLA